MVSGLPSWRPQKSVFMGRNGKGGTERLGFRKGGSSSTTGGYIFMSESRGDGSAMYFSAPSKFLGDKLAAYDGTLRSRVSFPPSGSASP